MTQLQIITGDEAKRLAELEGIVDRGLQTFIDVGCALREIQQQRLYRQTHARFGDYLRDRWGMGQSQGYRLIDAASVAEILSAPDVSPIGETSEASTNGAPPPPANEAVVRRLAKTARHDPERARQIWKQACREYGPHATAEQVGAIANEIEPKEGWGGWEGDARQLLPILKRIIKRKDPRDARRALRILQRVVIPALERIAESDREDDDLAALRLKYTGKAR